MFAYVKVYLQLANAQMATIKQRGTEEVWIQRCGRWRMFLKVYGCSVLVVMLCIKISIQHDGYDYYYYYYYYYTKTMQILHYIAYSDIKLN